MEGGGAGSSALPLSAAAKVHFKHRRLGRPGPGAPSAPSRPPLAFCFSQASLPSRPPPGSCSSGLLFVKEKKKKKIGYLAEVLLSIYLVKSPTAKELSEWSDASRRALAPGEGTLNWGSPKGQHLDPLAEPPSGPQWRHLDIERTSKINRRGLLLRRPPSPGQPGPLPHSAGARQVRGTPSSQR